jgi:drug/metabolite transporter (DMT)-like permease
MVKAQRSQLSGYLAALGTVAIWAGFMVISRFGGKSALTGWDIAALRLAFGSFFLLPFSLNLPRTVWRDTRLWTLAMLGGVGFLVLIYSALKLAPAAHGGILSPGTQPFIVTIAAFFILGARPDRARVIALLPIALGVICVAGPNFLGGDINIEILIGDALLLSASVVWAVYSVYAKKWAYDPWLLTRFLCLASALVYLPLYLLFAPKGIMSWSMILLQGLYQGIGPTILAMLFFLRAVEQLGAERTGVMIGLVPIISGLAAVPLLGEPLTVPLIIGMILVSAGTYFAARPPRKKA